MKSLTLCIILFILSFTYIAQSNEIVPLFVDGYGSDVKSDSTAVVSTITNCSSTSNSCLLANIVNENDYMGFRYSGTLSTDSLYFIEFLINVNTVVNDTNNNFPVVKVFIDTVPTPKSIPLTSLTYLSNLNIYGQKYVQGRIKLSELNVNPKESSSFNGIKFGCNVRGSTFILSNVQLVRDATGSDPKGWIPPKKKKSNAGKIAAGILVPLFVIAICIVAFIIYKKKKAGKL